MANENKEDESIAKQPESWMNEIPEMFFENIFLTGNDEKYANK